MSAGEKKLSENIPLKKQHLEEIFNETGFNSENLSIRETNSCLLYTSPSPRD